MMIIPFRTQKINPFFQKKGVDLEKFIFYSQQQRKSAKIDRFHSWLQKLWERKASCVSLVSVSGAVLSD